MRHSPAADLRVQTRRTGPNGNYWYAVELEENLKPGQVQEVVFWGTSIALYRGQGGEVFALANRCAHRHVRLSIGRVEDDCLTCIYHGWRYEGGGRCVDIAHEVGPARKPLPSIAIRSYPVRVRYGLIWLFPGDPALAERVPLPSIPVLEGSAPWPFVPIDMTIRSHFSSIIENGCDFYHAYLHRKYKPFTDSHLESYHREGDTIHMAYTSKQGEGWLARLGTPQQGRDLNSMVLWYQYPYQGSDMDGKYIQWLFVLPIDETTTRCFYLFLWGPMVVPLVRLDVPFAVRKPILRGINAVYLRPLLTEDKLVLEEEQAALAADDRDIPPSIEMNPIIPAFQKLTIEKWEEYVASERARLASYDRSRARLSVMGAGLRPTDLWAEPPAGAAAAQEGAA
jgi:phenylpropionate dioxygenase-like ring-hydroxylating dioxygenase large terminal subunit